MDTLIIATNISDSYTNAAKHGALLNSYELPIASEVSLSDSVSITMLRERSLEKLNDLKEKR